MKPTLFLTTASLFTMAALTGCSDNVTGTDNGTPTDKGATISYVDISPDSAYAMMAQFTKIFDVSPYYTKGHLPYSKDAGGVDGLKAMASSLDKMGSYLVYCHGDTPSRAGAQALIDAGISTVYRLRGNYPAWDAKYYVDITPAEAKRKIEAGELMSTYDVSPYWKDGHLPGATDAYGSKLSALIADDDVMKQYLVYCHADAPSMAGAQKLEENGQHNTYRLEGNFSAWKSAGYPVEMPMVQ